MRCGCPQCHILMIQSEGDQKDCVCPECGFRCHACQGTDTVLSPQQLRACAAELEHALVHQFLQDNPGEAEG